MRVHVANEFQRPLPRGANESIERFNGFLDKNPEELRRTLARKVLGRINGEHPEIDFAINELLAANQLDGRLVTFGFEPAEFTWGEIWREKNYRNMITKQAQLEAELSALNSLHVLENEQSQEAHASLRENVGAELAEAKNRRRIMALGVVAHINTERYQGPGAPLDFIHPSDLLPYDHSIKAA